MNLQIYRIRIVLRDSLIFFDLTVLIQTHIMLPRSFFKVLNRKCFYDFHQILIYLFLGSTDLGEDLDCAFRSYLHILLDEDLLDATNRTAVVQLLDYAIAFTLAFFVHHSSLVKIPYSMVDDILQSQTIQGLVEHIAVQLS